MAASTGLGSHKSKLMERCPISSVFPIAVWQAPNRTGEAHVVVVETDDFQIQGLITNGINYVGQSLFNCQIHGITIHSGDCLCQFLPIYLSIVASLKIRDIHFDQDIKILKS
jgi:hypothetical protein